MLPHRSAAKIIKISLRYLEVFPENDDSSIFAYENRN